MDLYKLASSNAEIRITDEVSDNINPSMGACLKHPCFKHPNSKKWAASKLWGNSEMLYRDSHDI
jgi:hypothetical protein